MQIIDHVTEICIMKFEAKKMCAAVQQLSFDDGHWPKFERLVAYPSRMAYKSMHA